MAEEKKTEENSNGTVGLTADQLAKEFKEHSVAEFFKKNKQMLGLTGKIRTLTTIVHEYTTNALDACEEAKVLPEIEVKISELGEEYYEVMCKDNGPGLTEQTIGKALAQLLAGTKFHRLMQSLTGEEPIIFKENNKICIRPIAGFAERFLKEGETEKDISKKDIEIPAFDRENYRYAFRKIQSVIRHRRENEIYKIKTVTGRTVKVTGCHSLFSLSNELQVREIEARRLNKGDFIVVPKKIPLSSTIDEINILEYFDPTKMEKNQWFVYNIPKNLLESVFKNAKILHIKNKTRTRKYLRLKGKCDQDLFISEDSVKLNYLKKGFLPLHLALKLGLNEKIKNCAIRTYWHGKALELPISWKITKELMRFLGLFVAEGHSDTRQIGFTFGAKEKELVKEMNAFAKSIGLNTTIEPRMEKNSVRLKLFGGIISSLMTKLCGHGAKNKKIPEFVFLCNQKMRQHFLDALYEGDGHNTKKRNQLMHSTVSKTLAEQLQWLWLFQGVLASKTQIQKKGLGKEASTVFVTTVYGSKIGESFVFSPETKCRKPIGELIPIRALNAYKKNRKCFSPTKLKLLEFLGLGANQTLNQKYLRLISNIQEGQIATATELRSFEGINLHNINHLTDNGYLEEEDDTYIVTKKTADLKNILCNMEKLIKSDIALLEVKEIERIDQGNEFVYDLSVPGRENFIAGNGGISCHNSRGQQGIGASGVTLLSLMTTGKPIQVITGNSKKTLMAELTIDPKKNEPKIIKMEEIKKEFRGTAIKAKFKDVKYQKSDQGAFEYLRRTAIANPHATITFIEPDGTKTVFSRTSKSIPERSIEVKPHPKGATVDEILTMAKATEARKVSSFLKNDFDRMGDKAIEEITKQVHFDMNKDPKKLEWNEAEEVVKAIKGIQFIAPRTDALRPIGKERVEASLKEIVQPEFLSVVERKPQVYSDGFAFQVEVAVAFGGNAGRGSGETIENSDGTKTETKKLEIMRFANRVPLLFDGGGCALTKAVQSIDWKRYGIKDMDSAPLTVFVHILSVHIPYTGAGKQAVSDDEAIMEELRLAIMDTGRRIYQFVAGKRREAEKQAKKKIFLKYATEVAIALNVLTGKPVKTIESKLHEIVLKRLKLEEKKEKELAEEMSDAELEKERKKEEKEAKKKKTSFSEGDEE